MTATPELLLFDGATGAGKSLVLGHLRENFAHVVSVGRKLTTRKRRHGDNEWEFQFVKSISEDDHPFTFHSVGSSYAIDELELRHTLADGHTYAVSCVDKRLLTELRQRYTTMVVYIYRAWDRESVNELLKSRGPHAQSDERREEIAAIPRDYEDKLHLYDHVLLNVGTTYQLIEQLRKLLRVHLIS